ncbi:SCO family protein [Nocardioides caricicola]|uniref:SCO family protein n=1 Tax=Nocardioides caricicola TaxID=634770 RepID=A0ABW0N1Z1_9ACTN
MVVAAGALTACGGDDGRPASPAIVEQDHDGYNGTLIDPPLQVAPVTLRDTGGEPVRLDRVGHGNVVVVFFGYTHCPDVCPTTMADLAAARRTLSPQLAAKVSLVFVTVDPRRDTPRVLRTWLDRFDPDIVGLRGHVSRVHRAERSLYASESGTESSAGTTGASAAAAPEPNEHAAQGDGGHGEHGGSGHEVDHSSIVYLFGPDGSTVLYTHPSSPPEYAADFARLLEVS